MLQEGSIKGYTTVKFIIGCWLIYLILHSIYKIYDLWNEQEQGMRKFIHFLILIVTISALIILKLYRSMYRFLMGMGRYNQLRYLKQINPIQMKRSSINNKVERSSMKKIQHQNPIQYNPNTINNQQANHLKKYHSFNNNFNVNEQTNTIKTDSSRNHKIHRASSLPNYSPSNQIQLKKYLQQQKYQQIQKSKKQYQQYINNNKNKKSSIYQKYKIQNAKIILGQIYKNQLFKNRKNLQYLKQRLQNLYYIEIINYKNNNKTTINNNNQQYQQKTFKNNNTLNFDRNYKILFNQIFENYTNGKLFQNTYKLKPKPSQDNLYKIKQFQKIQQLIQQRIKLDRQINYGGKFNNHQQRLYGIQKIQRLSKQYLVSQYQYQYQYQLANNQIQWIELKNLQIWILVHYINRIVKGKIQNIEIYLEPKTQNMMVQQQQNSIRWLRMQYKVLVHFNQQVTRNILNKNNVFQQKCQPGDNNIASIFVNYLNLLYQQFSGQLHFVPQLQNYVYQINQIIVQNKS